MDPLVPLILMAQLVPLALHPLLPPEVLMTPVVQYLQFLPFDHGGQVDQYLLKVRYFPVGLEVHPLQGVQGDLKKFRQI